MAQRVVALSENKLGLCGQVGHLFLTGPYLEAWGFPEAAPDAASSQPSRSAPDLTPMHALATLATALSLTAGFLTSAWANPATADWQRCRQVSEAVARLACYDKLADMAVAQPAAPVAAVAPAVPAPVKTPTERFGLEQKAAQEGAADTITSVLPGEFEGWGPKTKFTLANGQVWQVTDGSSVYWPTKSPKVTIRRGILGAFYLELEGLNTTAKVKRLQ